MSLQDSINKLMNKKKEKGTVAGEITADGFFGNMSEQVRESIVTKIGGKGTLDKTVKPGFVPVGLDASLFNLSKDKLNAGQIIRRNYLDAAAPRLQKAIASRDIFAYNAALAGFREGIGRTKGGPKLPEEMPDELAIRRAAIKRQQRQPLGSRAQTLGLSY